MFVYKKYTIFQNLMDVAFKLCPPRPFKIQTSEGRDRLNNGAMLFYILQKYIIFEGDQMIFLWFLNQCFCLKVTKNVWESAIQVLSNPWINICWKFQEDILILDWVIAEWLKVCCNNRPTLGKHQHYLPRVGLLLQQILVLQL